MIEGIYTPEQINECLELVVRFGVFMFATSVGIFTREMIYPKENTFTQNIGFLILSASIALGITLKLGANLTMAFVFLLCIATGFFVPAFKDWFRGKTIFKLLLRIVKGVKSASDSVMDEVDKELSKEDKDGKD